MMQRRDFLLFRVENDARVAELSCERLFMHYQDLSASYRRANAEAGTLDGAEWWAGEPALDIQSGDVDSFFPSVLAGLEGTEKLRIRDAEWLGQEGFGERVKAVIAAFKARGGNVSIEARANALDLQASDQS